MPKISVRECPFTGTLIADDQEYAKYLTKVRKNLAFFRKQNRQRAAYAYTMNRMRNEVGDLGDISQWIKDNHDELIETWNTQNSTMSGFKPGSKMCVKLENMRYTDTASNSHSAPIGKRTNWGGNEKGVPRGYPGFCGKIIIYHNNMHSGFAISGLLNEIGLVTGSGGGGHSEYSYDVTIWLDDWPLLREKLAWKKLGAD
jgi:hypothetical protein